MNKSKLLLMSGLLALSSTAFGEVKTIASMPDAFNDAISVDKKGQIYVSNAGSFGADGLSGSQVFTQSKTGESGVFIDNLNGPLGNTFDKKGNFYVSNMNTGEIYKRDKAGKVELFSVIVSGGGMAVNRKNELFVASYQGKMIYKIDKYGNAEVFSDHPLLAGGPVGISFDRRNNLYVGNYDDGKVLKIDKHGEVTEIATVTMGGNHIGYLVYADGDIYTTSLYTNKIYKVSLDGEVEEFAGTGDFGNDDGDNDQATFYLPNGITTNRSQDKLYVTEYYSPFVRAISLD